MVHVSASPLACNKMAETSTIFVLSVYESLNANIGWDEASCNGGRSSPVNIPREMGVPLAEVLSALQHFLEITATFRSIL